MHEQTHSLKPYLRMPERLVLPNPSGVTYNASVVALEVDSILVGRHIALVEVHTALGAVHTVLGEVHFVPDHPSSIVAVADLHRPVATVAKR